MRGQGQREHKAARSSALAFHVSKMAAVSATTSVTVGRLAELTEPQNQTVGEDAGFGQAPFGAIFAVQVGLPQ